MDPEIETLPSIDGKKEEDALEVKEDHLELYKGQNTRDGILDDRTIYSFGEELTDALEDSGGRVDEQGQDEASRLRSLATHVRDQDDLERDIGRQVGQRTSSTTSH